MNIRLRGGHTTDDPRLDRLPPTDWKHYEKFPLTAATEPDQPMPVGLFINWYSNFDNPVSKQERGHMVYYIGIGDLGVIRGGHAICADDWGPHDDRSEWWIFYDQGYEGACVGFCICRMASLLNRKRYLARSAYLQFQHTDEWEGGAYPGAEPFYEGTSGRAGLETWRTEGLTVRKTGEAVSADRWSPDPAEGISAYRWIKTWDEVRRVLGVPDYIDGVPLLNSWGEDYPRRVRLTDEAGVQLLEREDGEAATVTDA